MKYLFYKINLVALIFLLSSIQVFAQITISSPASGTAINECSNYILYYHPTGNYPAYVTVEVHQNNMSGAIVKTYSNVSGSVYLSSDYNNSLNSSGLSPGNYQIKVVDYYNSSNYGWSGVFSIVGLPPPSSISITQSSYSWFEINWPIVSGASSYRVDVSSTSDFTNILPPYNNYSASGTDPYGFYVTGVTAGNTYYVRIRSVNSCSTSSNSSTLTVIAPSCSPPPVPIATANSVAATSFVAHWDAVSGATNGYDIVVARSGDAPVTYSTTGTSYTVNSLHPSSNYSYYVVAKGCSNSSNSNTVNLTTLVLAAPAITVSTGDSDEWGFNWASVPGATSYEWVASLNNNYSSPYLIGTETGTSADIWKTCNRTYWRVRARCQTGEYSGWTTQTIPENAGCAGRVASEENLESDLKEMEVAFYPNPTDSFLRIDLSKTVDKDKMVFKINDSKGREIKLPITFSKNYVEVDVSEIPKGLYIVSVRDISFNKSFKFIRK